IQRSKPPPHAFANAILTPCRHGNRSAKRADSSAESADCSTPAADRQTRGSDPAEKGGRSYDQFCQEDVLQKTPRPQRSVIQKTRGGSREHGKGIAEADSVTGFPQKSSQAAGAQKTETDGREYRRGGRFRVHRYSRRPSRRSGRSRPTGTPLRTRAELVPHRNGV